MVGDLCCFFSSITNFIILCLVLERISRGNFMMAHFTQNKIEII